MVRLLQKEKELATISRQIEFVISDPQTQTTRVMYTPMNL